MAWGDTSVVVMGDKFLDSHRIVEEVAFSASIFLRGIQGGDKSTFIIL